MLTLDERPRLMMGAAMLLGNATGVLRSWSGADRSSGCYVTTYERVVDDQECEFAAMFDFLGWSIPGDVLREVVSAHSFTVRSGGRARGEADPFSHYRQGVAGDWRNHFDRDLARQFEEAFPHLLVDLGYEDADTWWESVPATLPSVASKVDSADQDVEASPRRVRALSDAMASALQERDARWTRYETAMNQRSAVLEQEVDSLRRICDERLGNIASLHAEAQLLRDKLDASTKECDESREAMRQLQGTCDERLALIRDQEHQLAERLILVHERDNEVRDLQSNTERIMAAMNERSVVLAAEVDSLRLVCEVRLENIESLSAEAQLLRDKLGEATRDADRSREAARQLQSNAEQITNAMNERTLVLDAEVDRLRRACEERLENIGSLSAEAQLLRDKLAEATKDSDESRAAVRELQGTCDERLALIRDQERQLEQRLALATDRENELRHLRDETDRIMTAMNERSVVLEREVATLRQTCEERLENIVALSAEAQEMRDKLDAATKEFNESRDAVRALQAICDERMALIEEQARTIGEILAAQAEPAGLATGSEHRIENDIVDGLSTLLGPGWCPVEFEDGVPFRWSEHDATIHVALVHEVRHTLTLLVEPGPGVGLQPFMLTVRLIDGTPLKRLLVRGRESISIELPREAPYLFSIVLNAEEGGAATPDDERVLDFRVFDVRLERADDVFPIWAEPESGFYPPEQNDGRLFRWISGDATIRLANARGATLSFDVESGPGFASQPFNLVVLAADGSEVASALVGTRVTVDVPIECSGRFDELTLHADGGGETVAGDERVMNFRVFARA
jgi:regulator of replication initiation timing